MNSASAASRIRRVTSRGSRLIGILLAISVVLSKPSGFDSKRFDGRDWVEHYVRNLWYMAAWAEEVPDGGFLGRRLLDRPWLLLRREDGGYAMLADRCPHRFAPLSRGRREGDNMFCGYHGLGFDAAGQCIYNPFGEKL